MKAEKNQLLYKIYIENLKCDKIHFWPTKLKLFTESLPFQYKNTK